ncbi:MAG: fimbrillin family protein [Muribaculaceae bacterium]|nr:fimbrillin family protein [Muribaculaceae bacterium]
MRISTILKMTAALMIGALTVTSCANDAETDINIDPSGDAISFSPSVGHASRATEVKLSNLGSFAVVARGLHHDGVLYNSYLIGSESGGDIATRDGSSSTWKLDHSVYWPAALKQVLFFAYTTLKDSDSSANGVLGSNDVDPQPSFGFSENNPYINNFAPLKATSVDSYDLGEGNISYLKADGKNQKDLLVAYTEAEQKPNQTSVSLKFEHALTQVSITAKQEGKLDSDHRIVKIKGAWIVNASSSGNLTSTGTKKDDNSYEYKKSWTGSGKSTFGSVWSDDITLKWGETDSPTDILREHSLMLIPENLKAWDPEKDKENANKGAYIMLLCRVELKHAGSTHGTNTNTDDIDVVGDNHYHQLFPVNKTKYVANEYGFVCVPLSSTWNTKGIGRHYTYNLSICGKDTGAGIYPPKDEEQNLKALVPDNFGIMVVTNDPDVTGKNPGANVLDDPIKFTVEVDGWEDVNQEWTPGSN